MQPCHNHINFISSSSFKNDNACHARNEAQDLIFYCFGWNRAICKWESFPIFKSFEILCFVFNEALYCFGILLICIMTPIHGINWVLFLVGATSSSGKGLPSQP